MPADWTYAKHGGLNYECEPGSVWRVKPVATLTIGNLTDLPPLPHAALAYCDPPWNQGNRNSFQTKAGLDHAGDPFEDFLSDLLLSIRDADTWAIEMGKQQYATLDQLVAARRRVPSEFDITYYHRHPAKLLIAPRSGDEQRGNPTGLDDDDTPAFAITMWTKAGDLVVDPVAGRGLTAVTAVKLGRHFAGYELSPHRASVALTKLAALTGQTPERIA